MKRLLLATALLTLILAVSSWACESMFQKAHSNIAKKQVLILEDGGSENGVYTIYSRSGFETSLGGKCWEFDGKNLSNYDLVILLTGNDYAEGMSLAAQKKLIEFVESGGTLLLTEWTTFLSKLYPVLNKWSPASYNESWDVGQELYTVLEDHPITKNLPAGFMMPKTWSYASVTLNAEAGINATSLIEGSKSNVAMSIRPLKKGHIIHWSMAGVYGGSNIWSKEVKQIFINIGDFAIGNYERTDPSSLQTNQL